MSENFSGRRGLIDRAIRAQQPKSRRAKTAYWKLIRIVRANSGLLSPHQYRGERFGDSIHTLTQMFNQIARWSSVWQRELDAWRPNLDDNSRAQWYSLLDHLFANYPIPRFLYSSWLTGSKPFIQIFIRLGLGQSPKKAVLKGSQFNLTKAMARHFMLAPNHLHPMEAIKWAQIRGTGGSHVMALKLINLRGPMAFKETLWFEYIRFIIRSDEAHQKRLPGATLSISDSDFQAFSTFVREQHFLPAQDVLEMPTINDEPLQPNFSFKGRTLRSFRRHMRNWRVDLQARIIELQPERRRRQPMLKTFWIPSSIGAFHQDQGEKTYTIEEITTAQELYVEGGIMRHCVFGYQGLCSRGATTIWSLKVNQGEKRKRLLTIQVCPDSRSVIQVRGKSNSAPTPDQLNIIQNWCEQEQLKLGT